MKIAIITGASSGLGREFVNQIKDVDQIWAIARRKDRLEQLKGNVLPIALDLQNEKSFEFIEDMLKKHKPEVSVLVNCAGFGLIGNFADINIKNQANMIYLNCTALIRLTSSVLPYMPKGSRIINLASSAGFIPQPRFAVYAASKSFVLSFSRALNAELEHIKTSAVCPGPVKTEFFDIAQTTGEISFYKKMFIADPVKVVAHAIKCKRPVVVYGFFIKLVHLAGKILPHRFTMSFIK